MTLPNLRGALQTLYGRPVSPTEVIELRGDASTRRYYRVRVGEARAGGPQSVIVMQLPEDAFQSDEGGERLHGGQLPFVEVAELLRSRGLPVPILYAEHLEDGIILLEDLGDLTFEQHLRSTPRSKWPELYGQAIDLLARLHDRCADLPEGSVVSRRRFDRQLLRWELDHFREWGLEAVHGPVDAKQLATLDESFARLVSAIEAMPSGFVHRDYQSKNLMVRPTGELAIIDFQDAMVGPRVYDLVALLCDSYVSIDLGLQESMIDRYAALRRIDPGALRQEFWHVALHRKLKDAGRFIYIDRVRRSSDFLGWYPQSLAYVGRAITHTPGFGGLGRLLRQAIRGFPDSVQKPASAAE